MYEFDIVLVDSRYSSGVPLQLVELAWKRNNFTLAGLFNFYDEVADEWPARILGARVFAGAGARQGIEELFETAKTTLPKHAEYGVLVVEDLDSPRDIICSYIENLGYSNVIGAANVQEALALLSQSPNGYFTIVTDLNMPGESGIDLIRTVRHDENLAHVPVVVLTAYATGDNLLECIKQGASGFVVKPPHKKTLRRELEKSRRLFVTRQSPRLCKAEEAHHLEEALRTMAVLG